VFQRLCSAVLTACLITSSLACNAENQITAQNRLITLDPGHFHAALVQKTMYKEISPVVHVYAPAGPDVENHLNLIKGFNSRKQNPTNWQEKLYIGNDYLEKLLEQKEGNIVIISGKNRRKTEYIKACVDAGLNVLADKPMCINRAGFDLLLQAFESAEQKGVLLYDIMTERLAVTSILQKELIHNKDVFGELRKGTEQDPAIIKKSTHHFFKYVAGKPLKRPAWYFDTAQQGEGIVDVTTHLVDIIMWMCFDGQTIDYKKDIIMKKARRWPTMISRNQYESVTGLKDFPDYLKNSLNKKGLLACFANGEMTYSIKGVYVNIVARWKYKAPEGGKDTHFSLIKGTKANIIIRQGQRQNYRPELYVEPAPGINENLFEKNLKNSITALQDKFPGLDVKKQGDSWHIIVPEPLRTGHESHFAQVVKRYLKYLKAQKLPEWEKAFIKAKYYTTTTALEMAQPQKQVKLIKAKGKKRIDVLINDRLFTSYRFDDSLDKPILLPINSPSDIMVTRGWPILNIKGESHDHPHHKGLWFAHRKVNNDDFWLDNASAAHIKHIKTTEMTSGTGKAQLSTILHWIDKQGRVLLEEKRDMVFRAETNQYTIDFDINLRAIAKKVVFTDHKDGMFAIQAADWLRQSTGCGKFLNVGGKTTAKDIWGKQSKWVCLQGLKNNRTIGIAVFNHPKSFRFPTHWHTRDYGLLSANPFGRSVYEPGKYGTDGPAKLKIKAGTKLHFKFLVIIFEGEKNHEQIEQLFIPFNKEKPTDVTAFVR